jgi:ribose 5-phosphate isomerase A
VSQDDLKRRAAEHAVAQIESGMTVGLGTGSTAAHGVRALGRRVREEGLKVRGVPTSERTRRLAEECGLPLVSFEAFFSGGGVRLDLCFDGADEADAKLNLTKGGGGALLREKVVAFASKRFICVVDSQKLVERLHAFPLPVEVVPFAQKVVERAIAALGGRPALRQGEDGPFLTDNGNWILDCSFAPIVDPPSLAEELSRIPGIAEHGLFCGMASELVVGTRDGVRVISR